MDAPPVQYVRTSDGFNIAFAVAGTGPPLVLMPEGFSHIQVYWSADTFVGDWYRGLAARFRLVHFDGRGQGMSSRGLPPGHSLQDDVADLELLVDHLGLDSFVLVSRSHAAVHYCTRHPDRVRALVLGMIPIYGKSWPSSWMGELARQDWQLFLSTTAGLNERATIVDAVNRLELCSTQEDWLVRVRAYVDSDIDDLLPSLRTPTLVLGGRGQRLPPLGETQEVAARIPNARFVLVDGGVALGNADQGIAAIESFLAALPTQEETDRAPAEIPASLSPRETEVLRLVAQGKSNQQIADELVISIWTVTNHLTHIFNKTGAANRTEAASYAHRHRLV